MTAVLDNLELGGREYDGLFGRTSLSATVSTFHCFDLIVHDWDLSRAAVRGPEICFGEDADHQTRILAYLGRDAR